MATECLHEIEVAVPFFDLPAVRKLLRSVRKDRRLRFTFAWPAEETDACAISPEGLSEILTAGHEVMYVPAGRRLHGKVYVADESKALVSSANLTRRGLGLSAESNAEIGILTQESSLVDDVQAWLDDLPRQRLTLAELELLRAWLARGGPPPRTPATEVPRDRAVVEQTLRRARRRGLIRAYRHIARGYGRNAFEVDLPRPRRSVVLRARVSEAAPLRDRLGYHFELTPKDAALDELHGFVLVAVSRDRQLLAASEVPTIFLPFRRAIGRKRNQLSTGTLRSAGRSGRRLSLERDAHGWTLRAKGVVFDISGCENDTHALRGYY
jgi:hypothetical protein